MSTQVIEDWKFIAMVLDRLFLFLFMAACLLGTGGIIFRAPSLYDMREPIGITHSSIGLFTSKSLGKQDDLDDYLYEEEEEEEASVVATAAEAAEAAGAGAGAEREALMSSLVYA